MKFFKKNILLWLFKYSFVFVFIFYVSMPVLFINAESDSTNINVKIENPLGPNLTDIPSFIEALINIVLYIGIPIIALAIIYTGFLFVQARGNSEELTKAKKALMYTLIGGAILLGAFVIANAIGTTVDEIKKSQ